MDCHFKADIIPVDFVANSLIVTAWHTAVHPDQRQPVQHITSGVQNPITWGEILDFSRASAIRSPSIKLVRPIARNPVSAKGVMGKISHLFAKLFSHFVFAYLFDAFLLVTGNKRIMVKVTQKMHRAFDVLEHFTNHQWCFRYHNYSQIFDKLSPSEQVLFESNVRVIEWVKYCDALTTGSRRYLLNEDDSTVEAGKRRQHWLTIAYGIFDSFLYLSLTGLSLYLGKVVYQTLIH